MLTVNRVVTERGGIVTARVTQDVWDAGFSCLTVPAGSVVTLDVGATVTNRSGHDGPRRCGPSGESHDAVLRESPHESYSAGLGIRCMAAR
ncbi:Conjugative transfer protein TrbI [Azospirillum argentinense]